MKPNLQAIRKRAGYKSAVAFAERIGMPKDTYTAIEQGKTGLSLERAWFFADILGCTLDELAGRESPAPTYADLDQAELNACWEVMDVTRRSALLVQARDGAAAMRGGDTNAVSDARALGS